MGSTVTVGRSVSAFRDGSGDVVYLLWEQTYSKNCHPHTPNWDCMAVGPAGEVIAKAFGLASECESGMLQNKSGRITPEGYIGTILQEMREPFIQDDVKVHLSVGEGYGYAIAPEKLGEVVALLRSNGGEHLAADLEAGVACYAMLHADSRPLVALLASYKVNRFRMLPGYLAPDARLPRDESLGFSVASNAKGALPAPQARVVGNGHGGGCQDILLPVTGGYGAFGWSYSLVGQYVCALGELGAAVPPNYKAMIGAYRAALETAPVITAARVVFNMAKMGDSTRKYASDRVAELRALPETVETPEGFAVPFSPEHAYTLCTMRAPFAVWQVDEEAVLPGHVPAPVERAPKLADGDVIEFDQPLSFTNGQSHQRFTVASQKRRGKTVKHYIAPNGDCYRISGRALVSARKVTA